jgi:hypothetical protein
MVQVTQDMREVLTLAGAVRAEHTELAASVGETRAQQAALAASVSETRLEQAAVAAAAAEVREDVITLRAHVREAGRVSRAQAWLHTMNVVAPFLRDGGSVRSAAQPAG